MKDLKFQAKFSRDRIVCPILAFSLSISKAERFPDSLVDSLLVNFGGVVLALLVIVVVVVAAVKQSQLLRLKTNAWSLTIYLFLYKEGMWKQVF